MSQILEKLEKLAAPEPDLPGSIWAIVSGLGLVIVILL
jgi:hypothetical protein